MENKLLDIQEIANKDKVFWNIIDAAVSLDIQKGHLKWTFTQLAKSSGVSRPLIYYYFGKSKENILYEGIYFFKKYILGTTSNQIKEWDEGKILPSIKLARYVLSKIPALIPFFYIHRSKDTRLGNELRNLRTILLDKYKKYFPHLKPDERQAIQVLIYGLAFYPDLPEKVLDIAYEKILTLLKPHLNSKS